MAKEKGRTFDGITRPSNETYRKRFNEVFKKEQGELDESYKQSLKNKKEREKTTSELLMEGYEEEKRMYEDEDE
tara:strand:- start:530 stop:751 length:222 start_codon:yes stop_codon:yes gene_type:complete